MFAVDGPPRGRAGPPPVAPQPSRASRERLTEEQLVEILSRDVIGLNQKVRVLLSTAVFLRVLERNSAISAPSARALAARDSCSVCLGEYDAAASVRTLRCEHSFHLACIDRWLQTYLTCPLCRRGILGNALEVNDSPNDDWDPDDPESFPSFLQRIVLSSPPQLETSDETGAPRVFAFRFDPALGRYLPSAAPDRAEPESKRRRLDGARGHDGAGPSWAPDGPAPADMPPEYVRPPNAPPPYTESADSTSEATNVYITITNRNRRNTCCPSIQRPTPPVATVNRSLPRLVPRRSKRYQNTKGQIKFYENDTRYIYDFDIPIVQPYNPPFLPPVVLPSPRPSFTVNCLKYPDDIPYILNHTRSVVAQTILTHDVDHYKPRYGDWGYLTVVSPVSTYVKCYAYVVSYSVQTQTNISIPIRGPDDLRRHLPEGLQPDNWINNNNNEMNRRRSSNTISSQTQTDDIPETREPTFPMTATISAEEMNSMVPVEILRPFLKDKVEKTAKEAQIALNAFKTHLELTKNYDKRSGKYQGLVVERLKVPAPAKQDSEEDPDPEPQPGPSNTQPAEVSTTTQTEEKPKKKRRRRRFLFNPKREKKSWFANLKPDPPSNGPLKPLVIKPNPPKKKAPRKKATPKKLDEPSTSRARDSSESECEAQPQHAQSDSESEKESPPRYRHKYRSDTDDSDEDCQPDSNSRYQPDSDDSRSGPDNNTDSESEPEPEQIDPRCTRRLVVCLARDPFLSPGGPSMSREEQRPETDEEGTSSDDSDG